MDSIAALARKEGMDERAKEQFFIAQVCVVLCNVLFLRTILTVVTWAYLIEALC